MADRSSAKSIDDYVTEFPAETRELLQQVRALIRESAPDATETISYAIPTVEFRVAEVADRDAT